MSGNLGRRRWRRAAIATGLLTLSGIAVGALGLGGVTASLTSGTGSTTTPVAGATAATSGSGLLVGVTTPVTGTTAVTVQPGNPSGTLAGAAGALEPLASLLPTVPDIGDLPLDQLKVQFVTEFKTSPGDGPVAKRCVYDATMSPLPVGWTNINPQSCTSPLLNPPLKARVSVDLVTQIITLTVDRGTSGPLAASVRAVLKVPRPGSMFSKCEEEEEGKEEWHQDDKFAFGYDALGGSAPAHFSAVVNESSCTTLVADLGTGVDGAPLTVVASQFNLPSAQLVSGALPDARVSEPAVYRANLRLRFPAAAGTMKLEADHPINNADRVTPIRIRLRGNTSPGELFGNIQTRDTLIKDGVARWVTAHDVDLTTSALPGGMLDTEGLELRIERIFTDARDADGNVIDRDGDRKADFQIESANYGYRASNEVARVDVMDDMQYREGGATTNTVDTTTTISLQGLPLALGIRTRNLTDLSVALRAKGVVIADPRSVEYRASWAVPTAHIVSDTEERWVDDGGTTRTYRRSADVQLSQLPPGIAIDIDDPLPAVGGGIEVKYDTRQPRLADDDSWDFGAWMTSLRTVSPGRMGEVRLKVAGIDDIDARRLDVKLESVPDAMRLTVDKPPENAANADDVTLQYHTVGALGGVIAELHEFDFGTLNDERQSKPRRLGLWLAGEAGVGLPLWLEGSFPNAEHATRALAARVAPGGALSPVNFASFELTDRDTFEFWKRPDLPPPQGQPLPRAEHSLHALTHERFTLAGQLFALREMRATIAEIDGQFSNTPRVWRLGTKDVYLDAHRGTLPFDIVAVEPPPYAGVPPIRHVVRITNFQPQTRIVVRRNVEWLSVNMPYNAWPVSAYPANNIHDQWEYDKHTWDTCVLGTGMGTFPSLRITYTSNGTEASRRGSRLEYQATPVVPGACEGWFDLNPQQGWVDVDVSPLPRMLTVCQGNGEDCDWSNIHGGSFMPQGWVLANRLGTVSVQASEFFKLDLKKCDLLNPGYPPEACHNLTGDYLGNDPFAAKAVFVDDLIARTVSVDAVADVEGGFGLGYQALQTYGSQLAVKKLVRVDHGAEYPQYGQITPQAQFATSERWIFFEGSGAGFRVYEEGGAAHCEGGDEDHKLQVDSPAWDPLTNILGPICDSDEEMGPPVGDYAIPSGYFQAPNDPPGYFLWTDVDR